ncbi:hypothetical protein [Rhizorhabdus dicambivorans]|uniref:hypothetical protein n=1 Tax=Rhizorhabdus dicambivorans TaxID=1850238 RepID=UPI001596C4A7|nr:hypothetical protein [Rhizorhabdus dicambivorans]
MDYRFYARADTAHPLAQAAFEEDGKLNSLSFRTHAGQWFIMRRSSARSSC